MDITTIINDFLHEFGSIDIAESEFYRRMDDDPEMKQDFKEWCDENGYRERTAFAEYCNESLSRHDEIFDSLSDYDE
ncbi:MAG: hypothetical protein ACI309_08615 [Candidatus Limisoma sp.]